MNFPKSLSWLFGTEEPPLPARAAPAGQSVPSTPRQSSGGLLRHHPVGLHSHGRWVGLIVEWPLLILFAICMVALIYRYGPDGSYPQWRWTSLGVITATILWIVGSILFSVYVYYFGNYNKIYGLLGMPLVLLTWMWLSVYAVLFGAEINGEAERQTRHDTMVRPPLPTGKQDAGDTDTVARIPPPWL